MYITARYGAEMLSTPVAVPTPDGDMGAHLWLPEGGSGPGILLLQEIFGVSSYIEKRAQDLADLGYVVLCPEIWWRQGVSKVDEGPEAMERAFALLEQCDWSGAVADGVAAMVALRAHPAVVRGVGIVGFCFGGGLGFAVAAQHAPDALVSYYGSALPELLGIVDDPRVPAVGAGAVSAPSLHHWGLADQFLTRPVVEQIREVIEPLPNVTFETYETGDHAFDNHDFFLYDADASRLAWERTSRWLAEVLPTEP